MVDELTIRAKGILTVDINGKPIEMLFDKDTCHSRWQVNGTATFSLATTNNGT
jgi:hypothetical protein